MYKLIIFLTFFTTFSLKMCPSFQLKYAKDYTNDFHSHSDHRQTHKYSEKRSNTRAKSATARMTHDGIAKERKSGKNHRETHMINTCADGIGYPGKVHQMNRRSEFVITRL